MGHGSCTMFVEVLDFVEVWMFVIKLLFSLKKLFQPSLNVGLMSNSLVWPATTYFDLTHDSCYISFSRLA